MFEAESRPKGMATTMASAVPHTAICRVTSISVR